ncbi:uncharacterized protein BJ212DRAFT_1305229 [Suillus subaureus]|uniref:Uncharacterized protein n=1 Tax=Suillus subaureus TaxID=48587 RepID=A0A9P7DQM6_9AGAM|nr:uncharacterized protein BJ212DRAFT_1305229 [Suillus subaureus]KAG1800647.1 hypothetical protein BJ212DRAFT_1305229 [Suillus subaureus]
MGRGNPPGSQSLQTKLSQISKFNFEKPTISPSTTMFSKRVTKLTEKAAQALAEGGQKLKWKISASSQELSQGKKQKKKPSALKNNPSTSEESVATNPTSHTEEDNTSSNAIIVDSSSNTSTEADISDAEASDDELSKSFIPV